MAIRARRRVSGPAAGPLPDRVRHYRSTSLQVVMLTSGSLAVAAVAGAVLGMRPYWRRAVEQHVGIVHVFMPSRGSARAWWLLVSGLAGIGEEITWRGVQTGLLVLATGSYAVSALLSALSFGGAHAVQGWKSAAVIVVFALGFQALVWFTGSLYVAMAVHVAYDVTAGLTHGRLGRERASGA